MQTSTLADILQIKLPFDLRFIRTCMTLKKRRYYVIGIMKNVNFWSSTSFRLSTTFSHFQSHFYLHSHLYSPSLLPLRLSLVSIALPVVWVSCDLAFLLFALHLVLFFLHIFFHFFSVDIFNDLYASFQREQVFALLSSCMLGLHLFLVPDVGTVSEVYHISPWQQAVVKFSHHLDAVH